MKLIMVMVMVLLTTGLVLPQSIEKGRFGKDKSGISATEMPGYLNIPERSDDAIGASAFVRQVAGLAVEEREKAIASQILSGNVPSFARILKPVKVIGTIDEKSYELIFFCTADYLAIGSDTDYMYVPLTPLTAQSIANHLDCLLPTKKIVDSIYAKAEIKLRPQPIPPSEKMTTLPVFWQHTDSVKQQMVDIGWNRMADKIIAGHKKDIILSIKIYDKNRTSDKVIIYGWHKAENDPIQPVYGGHAASYADYSHGLRFISNEAMLNGKPVKLDTILSDVTFSELLSDEGVIKRPYYPME